MIKLLYRTCLTTDAVTGLDLLFSTWNDRPALSFIELNQVHGRQVHSIRPHQDPAVCDGDGHVMLFADWPDLRQVPRLAIKTADCLPVAIFGRHGVAFCHAGRAGLEQGILMAPALQAIAPVRAVIGPAICAHCYIFHQRPSTNLTTLVWQPQRGLFELDLVAAAITQLQEAWGMERALIQTSHLCTCCGPTNFPSYRRNQTTQRNYHLLHWE